MLLSAIVLKTDRCNDGKNHHYPRLEDQERLPVRGSVTSFSCSYLEGFCLCCNEESIRETYDRDIRHVYTPIQFYVYRIEHWIFFLYFLIRAIYDKIFFMTIILHLQRTKSEDRQSNIYCHISEKSGNILYSLISWEVTGRFSRKSVRLQAIGLN